MNSRESTKHAITSALYELAYSKPFDSISISEVCEKAKVSRMSFYRYFTSLDDVFIVYCDERFDEFFAKMKENPSLNYDELLLLFFNEIKNKSKQVKLLEITDKLNLLSILFESYTNFLLKKILPNDEGVRYNKYTAPFVAGGLSSVIIRWCKRDFSDTPEEMVNCIKQMLITR